MPLTRSLLALVVLLCAAPTVRAGEMRIPLARLVDQSELVVVARATSVKGLSIARTATAEVEQVWKGPPTDALRFRAGGLPLTGDVSWTVAGERAVLFLRGASAGGRWSVVEFGHGRLTIERAWQSDVVALTPDVPTLFNPRVILEGEYADRWQAPFDVVEAQARARLATLDALREELLGMHETHQRVHANDRLLALPEAEREELRAEAATTDAEHVARLRDIVAEFGWPGRTKVGADASHAAFVLVQQADHAPEFQASMLPRLKYAITRSGVPRADVAELTDRVRVNQDLPQVYGTQYPVETDADGEPTYAPPVVEDIERLDARRAAAGLRPWLEVERERAAAEGRDVIPQPTPAPQPPQRNAESGGTKLVETLSLPREGNVLLVVHPGPSVSFEGETTSLHDLRAQLGSDARPLAERKVILECDGAVAHDELVLVVDALLKGDCTDVDISRCNRALSDS